MRLIDADFIESLGATCIARRNEDGTLCPISAISMIPTVDAPTIEERTKGKWRSVGFEKGYAFCICSNCGKTTRLYRDSKNEFCCIADIRNKVIACMYCGADMRSVDEGLHERAVSDLSKTVDDLYKKLRGEENE